MVVACYSSMSIVFWGSRMFAFGSVMDGLFLNSPILQCTWKNFSWILTYESFPCPCHEGIQGEQSYWWESFLNSPLDESEWLTPRPSHLTPGPSPVYSLNVKLPGGGGRACFGDERNLLPIPGFEPHVRRAHGLVTIRTTVPSFLVLWLILFLRLKYLSLVSDVFTSFVTCPRNVISLVCTYETHLLLTLWEPVRLFGEW